MSNQPRIPTGVPTGGQFSVPEKTEAGVELRPLDGSFLYPPVFTTAEDIIDFWSRVEIPDEVLARTERLYREGFEPLGVHWPSSAWRAHGLYDWRNNHPQPDAADVAATAAWEGECRVAQADYEENLSQVMSQRPETLDRRDVRPLVRAAAMFRSAVAGPDDDFYAVSGHPIVLTAGTSTVGDAAINSTLAAMPNRFLDADNYDLDRSRTANAANADGGASEAGEAITKDDIRRIVQETINQAILEQNVSLDAALDELTDNIGAGFGAVIDVNDPKFGKRKRR